MSIARFLLTRVVISACLALWLLAGSQTPFTTIYRASGAHHVHPPHTAVLQGDETICAV